jgi:hypothetical protein
MNRYLTRTICVIGLIFVIATVTSAQSKKTKATSRGERLINALINSKNSSLLWGEDGIEHGDMEKTSRFFRLGRRAIPLLIKHLNDRRIIEWITRLDQENQENVTVGEVVLNILTYTVRIEAPFFDMECVKDNRPFVCLSSRFDFGRRGKQNWLKAYRTGKIHYQKAIY